jgi:hypothetical protein
VPVEADSESVGKVNGTVVLAELAVEDAVAAQSESVADTVAVDTRVTAIMLSVSMATVGITILFVGEENVVPVVVVVLAASFDVVVGMELKAT